MFPTLFIFLPDFLFLSIGFSNHNGLTSPIQLRLYFEQGLRKMMCTLIFTIRSRQPVFTFDNEKALFKFQYQKPSLAPLLKLPPT